MSMTHNENVPERSESPTLPLDDANGDKATPSRVELTKSSQDGSTSKIGPAPLNLHPRPHQTKTPGNARDRLHTQSVSEVNPPMDNHDSISRSAERGHPIYSGSEANAKPLSSRTNKQKSVNGRHGSPQSRRPKRGIFMPDHMAAAMELGASPNVSAAPAAAPYWSRPITFGRGPSRPLRTHSVNLVGDQLFVFGGCDNTISFNSLYILEMDTMTWSKPRVAGQPPPPCRAHSSTFVELEDNSGLQTRKLYVFGGADGPNYFNTVHVLDIETLTWSKPSIQGTQPSPRRAHTANLWNNKIVIFGGGDDVNALSDLYFLDLTDPENLQWSVITPQGTPPAARGYHTSCLVKNTLFVFGGSDGHQCFSDMYALDLEVNRWTQVALNHSVPRLAHSATLVGSYIFVIGGHDGSCYSSDVLLFNLVTLSWELRKAYGGGPSPRGYHATVLYDSRLYVLGGFDGRSVFDDVFMLELSACAYLPQITNFEIDI